MLFRYKIILFLAFLHNNIVKTINLRTMNDKEKAFAIVQLMYENDAYSKWLGIQVLEVDVGTCILKMRVGEEMLNGFGIAHGGITYAFADSALAFASNAHGQKAVSIETSISHLKAVKEGDTLIAVVFEKSKQYRIAVYEVEVRNQKEVLVALFKGSVYRKREEWGV